MTKDKTTVTAFRLKNLGAGVAAGVRDQPGIERGVVGFAAVAAVPGRDLLLRVALSTLWTAPVESSGIVGSVAAT